MLKVLDGHNNLGDFHKGGVREPDFRNPDISVS